MKLYGPGKSPVLCWRRCWRWRPAGTSLDEVASVLGCTKEKAAAEMEQLGISPIKVSTLPGFEWVLGE